MNERKKWVEISADDLVKVKVLAGVVKLMSNELQLYLATGDFMSAFEDTLEAGELGVNDMLYYEAYYSIKNYIGTTHRQRMRDKLDEVRKRISDELIANYGDNCILYRNGKIAASTNVDGSVIAMSL